MRYDYFLEYGNEGKHHKILDFLELDTDIDFEHEYEMGTLVIYTNEDPVEVESMVYDATGAYADNYGQA